jgi:hypothetical protein
VEGKGRRLNEWDFFYCAPGTEAHHRGGWRAVRRNPRCRCPWTWRRRWHRLQGLQGCGALRSERGARNCGSGYCVRERMGEAPPFKVRQVPPRLARRLRTSPGASVRE